MAEDTGGTAEVVRKIMHYIRRNGLAVGDRLPSIREMSQMWGIGRNVIRDGLQKAQSLGLVRILPRSGAYVSSPDFSALVDALTDTIELSLMQEDVNILHLSNARIVIESAVVEEAARWRRLEDLVTLHENLNAIRNAKTREDYVKADERFHLTLAKIAGNPALQAMLRALLVLLRPYRMGLVPDVETSQRAEYFHQAIYEAVRDGRCEEARDLLVRHLTQASKEAIAGLGGPAIEAP